MEHKRSLFGPLLLIAAGVLWLLVKSDAIPSSNLWALTHVWPFLLIAAGVGLLMRPYWSYTSIMLDIVIVGGLFASILYAPKMGWDNPSMVSFGDNGDLFVGPGERGSGKIIEETRKVSNFDSVRVDYPASIFISQGKTESVKIEADDDVLPGLKTEVKNNELRIYYKKDGDKRINPTKTIVITIIVKELKAVDFTSAGELTMDGINSDGLDISLSGAGNIDLNDVNVKELSVNMSGAGSMTTSGTADDLSLNISGFGDFNGKDLQSKTGSVNISGAGGASVWTEDELSATISGAGSVDYYGSPSVTKNINGVGSVSQHNK
jgi:Putative auto-transporter adhesin, head GIN domain/Domain of unknown function (DUF5668)